MITLGGLGWGFALGKVLSAVLVGIIVALGTVLLTQAGWLRDQVQQGVRKHVAVPEVPEENT